MSDLVIPGTGSSNFNTKEIIELTMQRERLPLERMNAAQDRAKEQRQVWQDLNRLLTQLRDNAAGLYGFQNPFQSKIATSGDEQSYTATATREAEIDTHTVQVDRIAAADRMLSRAIDRTYRAEPGRYVFRVGEREVAVDFAGGSLADFANALTRGAAGRLKASIVRDTANTDVLLLESLVTGTENKLTFLDRARELAVAIGLIEPTDDRSVNVDLSAYRSTGQADKTTFQQGELVLSPGGAARIPVSPAVRLDRNMVMELDLKVRDLDRTPWTPPPPPQGLDIKPGESLDFRGITLRNASSRIPTPPYTPPTPPTVVDDLHLLSLEAGGQTVPLPPSDPTPQYRRVRVQIGELADSASALLVSNPNTYRGVSIRNVKIFDVTARGDARPLNALTQAQDAQILVDGVPVSRSGNVVDDLIPGLTLTLRAPGERTTDLSVTPDAQGIKNAIVAFVGRYNQALTEIDVVTRRDETIVSDAYYATEEDRKSAQERLGILSGDMTLARLKSGLSTLVMNSYPTGAGRDLALLAQIGIATNTGAPGGAGLDRSRLRGYLDIEETKLEAAIRDRTEAVRQLFGYDTDGDLVVDSGVAYAVDQNLRAYVGRAGVLSQRIGTIDGEITRRDREIQIENQRLDDTEAELKQKYAEMEGALQSLEQSSKRLEGFTQQNR